MIRLEKAAGPRVAKLKVGPKSKGQQQRGYMMAIYELTDKTIRPIEQTKFASAGINERGDLQRLLREQVEIISPDNRTYVFTNQWGNRTLQAIDLLNEAFPDTAISYEKSC